METERDGSGWEVEVLEGVKGEEIIIRIYYVKKNLFSIKGKKNLVLVELDPKEF